MRGLFYVQDVRYSVEGRTPVAKMHRMYGIPREAVNSR